MRRPRMTFLAVALSCCFLLSGMSAQETERTDDAPPFWSSPAFSPHVLLQAGSSTRLGSDPTAGTYPNAITAHTSRLQLRGSFESGFEYYVQWSFVNSPSLLDTRIGYRLSRAIAFDIGMFKTPAGQEFLTATENTDFVSSASLLAFGPKRDAGIQARVNITDEIQLRGGRF